MDVSLWWVEKTGCVRNGLVRASSSGITDPAPKDAVRPVSSVTTTETSSSVVVSSNATPTWSASTRRSR